MKIYNYNQSTGVLLNEGVADASPLERDVFLIPANATTIAPPDCPDGHRRAFREGGWIIEPIPAPPQEPEPAVPDANAETRMKIAALEAEFTVRLQLDLALRPNVPILRPNSAVKVPKKPIDFITDIDSQIEALRATLIP